VAGGDGRWLMKGRRLAEIPAVVGGAGGVVELAVAWSLDADELRVVRIRASQVNELDACKKDCVPVSCVPVSVW